jgi:hypothetical protein
LKGRQLGDGFALECTGDAQVLLGDQGVYVGLDRDHFEVLSNLGAGILPDTNLFGWVWRIMNGGIMFSQIAVPASSRPGAMLLTR